MRKQLQKPQFLVARIIRNPDNLHTDNPEATAPLRPYILREIFFDTMETIFAFWSQKINSFLNFWYTKTIIIRTSRWKGDWDKTAIAQRIKIRAKLKYDFPRRDIPNRIFRGISERNALTPAKHPGTPSNLGRGCFRGGAAPCLAAGTFIDFPLDPIPLHYIKNVPNKIRTQHFYFYLRRSPPNLTATFQINNYIPKKLERLFAIGLHPF